MLSILVDCLRKRWASSVLTLWHWIIFFLKALLLFEWLSVQIWHSVETGRGGGRLLVNQLFILQVSCARHAYPCFNHLNIVAVKFLHSQRLCKFECIWLRVPLTSHLLLLKVEVVFHQVVVLFHLGLFEGTFQLTFEKATLSWTWSRVRNLINLFKTSSFHNFNFNSNN